MNFTRFHLFGFAQFFVSAIWVFLTEFTTVAEIALGCVLIWGSGVILLTIRDMWKKTAPKNGESSHIVRVPRSESYRLSLATGVTGFLLSIMLLGTAAKPDYSTLFYFLILFVSMQQLVSVFLRASFQVRAHFRRERMMRREKTV